MNRFFVYILFSEKLNRFYSGITTLDVGQRLQNHIDKVYSNKNFTQKAEDWTIFHFLECDNFSQARKIELHIKRMKSKIYILNLKKYPDLGLKLLEKYRAS